MNTTAQRDFMFYIGTQGQVISLRNQISIQISRSPMDVFNSLADLEQITLWQSSIQEVEIMSRGETRLGTAYYSLLRAGGRLHTVEGVITAFHPGHRFATRETDPAFVVDTEYMLAPTEDGTRLDVVSHVQGKGGTFSMMLQLLSKRTGRSSRKLLTRDMHALKSLLETDLVA